MQNLQKWRNKMKKLNEKKAEQVVILMNRFNELNELKEVIQQRLDKLEKAIETGLL